MTERKPILCLDFDGVLHSYVSGWKGADVVADPPVPGWLDFLRAAVERFDVQVFSSRSNQDGGIDAMQAWLRVWALEEAKQNRSLRPAALLAVLDRIKWPLEKPAAMVTIDDRAITFSGRWPDVDWLLDFKPWNKP